jgi:hypothetical protein
VPLTKAQVTFQLFLGTGKKEQAREAVTHDFSQSMVAGMSESWDLVKALDGCGTRLTVILVIFGI